MPEIFFRKNILKRFLTSKQLQKLEDGYDKALKFHYSIVRNQSKNHYVSKIKILEEQIRSLKRRLKICVRGKKLKGRQK